MYCDTNWDYVSLSDPETVKALLFFRSELDPTYNIEDRRLLESGFDIADVNENIHLTYIELQKVMDEVDFTDKQKFYIDLLSSGMDEVDIAKYLGYRPDGVRRVINNICKLISDKNNEIWCDWVRWDYKRVDTNYRLCAKCGKYKPHTADGFLKDYYNSDCLSDVCKECGF